VSVLTLDGPAFSRALRGGALAVMREQEVLNRINVGVGEAARVAADGALEGARGNSGAIFAQFLHGLAGGMAPHQQVDGVQFAVAAGLGTESAYSALQEPREGTILSVLRAWSHELTRRAHEDEFVEMMHGGLVEARAALAETEHQLKVLALNHVVDAGGQGFVYFLEGLLESLRGRSPQWAPAEASPRGIPPFSPGHDEVDDRYRYCTEVLLAPDDGRALSRDAVMAAVGGLGDSLVVAGGERRLRVHLHTNEPQRFIAAVASLGVLERSKIDDMVLQQLAGRESTVALVTDSTTDMPEEDAFKLGVVTVPLTLVLGDEEYLDGVDITAEGFVRRVSDSSLAPHSSQPAASDFA
jgi:dihydroxyacetone kinase-like predicted kinase